MNTLKPEVTGSANALIDMMPRMMAESGVKELEKLSSRCPGLEEEDASWDASKFKSGSFPGC